LRQHVKEQRKGEPLPFTFLLTKINKLFENSKIYYTIFTQKYTFLICKYFMLKL
jgi:hypothetical protein